MKFNLNINYELEADTLQKAHEMVAQLSYVPSFAIGSARATGMNLNQHYEGNLLAPARAVRSPQPAPEGADAENDGADAPDDDDIPF